METKEKGYIIYSVLILLVLSSIPMTGSTEAIPPPGIYIGLKAKIVVEHENFNDTSVDIVGRVYFDVPITEENGTIHLELFANSTYFTFSSIPILIFDRANRIQDFNFTMLVPYATPGDEYHLVTVNGRILNNNSEMHGQINPTSIIVVVKQNYSFRINSIESSSIRAGHSHSFKVNISNLGNGPDSYSIRIPSLINLSDDGWEIQIHENKSEIPPGQHHIETINIKVPFDEKTGVYKIGFVLESRGAESQRESYEKINGTIQVKVLNNYKDEIIKGLWFATPIAIIILMMVCAIILHNKYRKRNRRLEEEFFRSD